MKKVFVPLLIILPVMLLLTGCLNLSLGGGSRNEAQTPTIGQQLLDLQKARNSGVISQGEYEALRARLVNGR